jgi:hypothetical protein
MDSEGIGSTDEDQTHDTRIFSLTILLASSFIYNSMGSIDVCYFFFLLFYLYKNNFYLFNFLFLINTKSIFNY